MKRLFILLIFLSFIIINCSNIRPEGGDSLVTVTAGSNAKTAKLKIEKATIYARIKMLLKGVIPDTAIAAMPSAVNKIIFTIEGADIEAITKSVNVSGQSEITEEFMIPNGDNRRFTVDAIGPSNGVLYTGSTSVNLDGMPVTLTIDMVLRPWARSYGGAGVDYGGYILQTTDGGYIVSGGTYSFGAGDMDSWVLKLNSDGSVAWQKTYGGGAGVDVGSLIQTSDGGYIVGGRTDSFGAGSDDVWVLKLNSDGSVAWQKTYGGAQRDFGYSIQQTTDGGYIVAGETNSFGTVCCGYDMWILKLNSSGTVTWQKTYGGLAGRDFGYSIQLTTDGGYIVSGGTYSFGAGDMDSWVLKLNSDGSTAWQKTYGGAGVDYGNSIQQTTDGGYIVSGWTTSFGAGSDDFWVLKLNSDGSVAWQKTYGGAGIDRSQSIQQTTDGGYIVSGGTYSFGAGGLDSWILKLNSDGSVAWQKTYGGAGTGQGLSIQQTTDGGYITTGGTTSSGAGLNDVWVLKLASDGTINFNASSSASTTNTNAVITDTSVTGADTGVTGADTNVTPADSSATVTDTNAVTYQQAP